MTDKQISEILEEEGYSFTDNLEESVFILKNGNLVDGGFFGGDTQNIEKLLKVLFQIKTDMIKTFGVYFIKEHL